MNVINNNEWESIEDVSVRTGMKINTAFGDTRQDALFRKEEHSWWFAYRAKVVKSLIDKYFDRDKLLWDIGAGNGYTSFVVQSDGYKVATMEPSYEACKNARKRGLDNVLCGTLDRESVYDNSLEAAMALDVIEHIEDDQGFLELMYSKLDTDSYALITVPAFMSLWSSQDAHAGHFRRYRFSDLKDKCEKAGFSVVYGSYFMRFAYIPVFLVRVLLVNIGLIHKSGHRTGKESNRVARIEHGEKKGLVGSMLRMLEKRELDRIKNGKKLPYGSSLIMVVKKGNKPYL